MNYIWVGVKFGINFISCRSQNGSKIAWGAA